MPSNTAAWQSAPGVPLAIKSAAYTSPTADEIVIRNRALAINPIDFRLQDVKIFPFLEYPTVLGNDVSGEVAEVGSAATGRFEIGDRIVGQAIGTATNIHARGGFQEYTVTLARLTSVIPSSLSFIDAAVLPLGLSTASCGLFQTTHLGLQHPSLSPKATGQTLLVWGGASSVGTSAIQLAVAAGYEVISTASPKNFGLVKNMGGSEVFDYHQDPKSLTEQLVEAFKNRIIAGAFQAAGDPSSGGICCEILARSDGNKFLATTVFLPESIPEVSTAVYEKFLPQALAEGKFVPAPEAEVVGNGLEAIQTGIDVLRKGVSAKKLVVTLD